MRRLAILVWLTFVLLSYFWGIAAQEPVPTLIPPTPIPRAESGIGETLPTQSAVARMQADGVLRVGMLFNAPPFAELNVRGELAGFDADLARLLAETWGVEIEFIQITRDIQASTAHLQNGEIDMLVGAQVNHRSLAPLMEFSQTYYLGQKSMMVRSGEGEPQVLHEMAGRRVGVVIATPAQEAAQAWNARSDAGIDIETYLTLDQAFVALISGQIDGVIDSDHRLSQVSIQQPESVRILTEPIEFEPYAVAVRRQDINMRQFVNRTLQFLTATGQLRDIHQDYFPGRTFHPMAVWDNVGDSAPSLSDYAGTITLPEQFVVGRLVSSPVVRVAGLFGVTADSEVPESRKRLDVFHRQLVEAMASRWGATVEYIPDSTQNALELVASGQADIAVGISPDWNHSTEVDFTSHYLRHGYRLMIRAEDSDDVKGFGDLSGETIITPLNEAGTVEYARSIAEERNWRLDVSQQREEDLGFILLGGNEDVEAEAVFADSLKLVPHVQADPQRLVLTDTDTRAPRWYSPSKIEGDDFGYRTMALAVPRNDADFRLLVEMTLQELERDGTLATLLESLMLSDEVPSFEIWPGSSTFLNFSLGQ